MINYYDLNKLINSGLEKDILDKIIISILNITLPIKQEYPEYKNWFMNTHVPNLGIKRNILFATYKNNIVGVVNIKSDEEEKKICTLYVEKGFRFRKVGTTLLNMAFNILETNKPLITISDSKIYDLKKFIVKNNWEVSQKLDNFYTYNNNEYVFNGSLYVPNNDDEVFKIYRKENNSIFRIVLITYFYKIKKLINKFNYQISNLK